MGPLVGVLCFLGAAVAWSFFTFQPEYANKKALSVFNWSVMGAGAMIVIAFMLKIDVFLSGAPPEEAKKYKVAFEIAGALGVEICWLAIMFVIRNFWLFKPPRRPGGWG
jgi:hypothetical protein